MFPVSSGHRGEALELAGRSPVAPGEQTLAALPIELACVSVAFTRQYISLFKKIPRLFIKMVHWRLLLLMQRLLLNLFNKMILLPPGEDIGQLPPDMWVCLNSTSDALCGCLRAPRWAGGHHLVRFGH